MPATIMKIVSGGQTGVDRAAWDAAIHCGLPHGGWVPLGRLADGDPIEPDYVAQETPTPQTSLRTEWNIRDSDATLILHSGELKGGTKLTWELANVLGKPVFRVDIDVLQHEVAAGTVIAWLNKVRPRILNVAGPLESEVNGVYKRVHSLLVCVFSAAGCCSEEEGCNSRDVDVVLARYEQAQANFRHWDQIRWLTPYWFIAIFAGFAALMGESEKLRAIQGFLICSIIGLVVFAAICIFLMIRLIVYHNAEIEGCRNLVRLSPLSSYQREVLLTKLPFELRGKHLLGTATLYLILLIGLLSVVAVIILFVFRP
ncbi:MAG TPA: putative molybdenum carrier protein [Terracidiphilus sp.]|nr:putative molybdenum carrier protein [Terracidiphilus sp.]